MALIVLVTAFTASVRVASASTIELLDNGDFEEGEAGLSKEGWRVNNAGKLSLVPDARSGKLAARFVALEHEWGFCGFTRGIRSVTPNATFRLSVWAKGHGTLALAVYQSSAAGFIGTKFLEPKLRLTDQWQELALEYRADDARIRGAAFAIHLFGKDAVATIDDASCAFDPERNPGVTLEQSGPNTRELRVHLRARNADVSLFVSGQPAGPGSDGVARVRITEGVIPLAVKAQAKDAKPGVCLKIDGHPETAGRWRVGTEEKAGWRTAGFNDTRWPVATPATDGFVWDRDASTATVLLRQVIIWNKTHHGPNRCLVPPVREWGFPRGGMETLRIALYSPLPFRLNDFELTLEVPEEFQILNKTDYASRYIMNNPARKLLAEPTTRDGRRYTRFRMFHKPGEVKPDQTQYTLVPVKMVGDFEPDTCRFYLRRSARGNFTELEQAIPVNILPPVNGRQPKKIMISQYAPLGYSTMSKEHLSERLAQDATAGCNTYMLSYAPGWGELWRNYVRLFHDTAVSNGARIVLWSNFPLNYGGTGKGHLAQYPTWIHEHLEAHGRYYKNTPRWGEHPRKCPYCNQYAISEEGGEFWRVVKQEYARMLELYPKASMFWSDWEFHNVNKDGTGVHCFCDRCKKAFRQFAKLPADGELTDEEIMAKHRQQWIAFRDYQDGEIVGRMARTARELGRTYMTYSWSSNNGFWGACKGKLDAAFAGVPGNSVADSYYQRMLDDFAVGFFERTGLKQLTGQRFVFFKNVSKDGWKAKVLAHDGYVDPKSWKTQVLRIVATLHGGVDLQNSTEFAAGIRYYLGEATRIIGEYERLFWDGERADDLAESEQMGYPNLLVLKLEGERLVLLFNEGKADLTVTLRNKGDLAERRASVFGTNTTVRDPRSMTVVVPSRDVAVVHIR